MQADTLFKFQWHIEKDSPELCVGPGLISTSLLSNIKKGPYSQLTGHEWIHVAKNNAKKEIVAALCNLNFKWIKVANNIKSDTTILQGK